MFKITNLFKKVTKKAAKGASVLYAVFEKETEKFLGVGGFTDDEIKTLSNKYVFTKI